MPLRNTLTIFQNTCRNIPQVHGYIIIAFHLEVFRVSYFPQGRHRCKRLYQVHEQIDMLYSIPKFIAGVNQDTYMDSVTHTQANLRISNKEQRTKNKT